MKVLIAGATGAVGSELIKLLIQDHDVESIISLVRRPTAQKNTKLDELQVNFDEIESLPSRDVDVAFCCLGTTMKKAGSKAAFRKVDHDYIVSFARWAMRCGVKHFHLVSAIGANPNSANFYSRVKGETEEEIKKLGFDTLCIYKPSLLVTQRKEKRLGEQIGIAIMQFFNPLMRGPFEKYRSIDVSVVADGMYARMTNDQGGVQLIESNRIPRKKIFGSPLKKD